MPRANRYFIPGHVWHLTQRCHQQQFLLRYAHNRQRWIDWLYEAKKRFGLSVLNYVVTSNHIHLLVRDTGSNRIQKSMQLIAGRTAQEYNQHHSRKGAFWEDRYHATAIETEVYLLRCMAYIDLNMVRAGVVAHPSEWLHGGFQQIAHPTKQSHIIDQAALNELAGVKYFNKFQIIYLSYLEDCINSRVFMKRDECFSNSLAIGSNAFLKRVKQQMGASAMYREINKVESGFSLREPTTFYNQNIQ
ncbi:MAG: transposase [Gammaproteobacteria bacterium]|nr:transposase [Gammaproteobacteria bacterium]